MWRLVVLFCMGAAAGWAAPLPPPLRELEEALEGVDRAVAGLEARIEAERRNRAAWLAVNEQLTRQMLGLARWPEGLLVLGGLRDDPPLMPGLMGHIRLELQDKMADNEARLAGWVALNEEARKRKAELVDLRAQFDEKRRKLNDLEVDALRSAALGANQLAADLAAGKVGVRAPAAAPARMPVERRLGAKWPVAGRPEAHGKGILFRTARAAPVYTTVEGKVIYSGPFRQFGGLVIVETAARRHQVLAGLETLQVTAGQRVAAGEMIGKSNGRVYWEARRDGKAVTPVR